MDLCDLALSSLMFDALTGYTLSLRRLASDIDGALDLGDCRHRMRGLKWLNDWGCRHLAREYHEMASDALFTWHMDGHTKPFADDRVLWDLTEDEMAAAAAAYASLKEMTAAWRTRHGHTRPILVQIGPTAASKVLFALRPKALLPWDDAIREGFSCDGSGESYHGSLRDVQLQVRRTAAFCEEVGIDIANLPTILGQPCSTVAELINKYLWMKHAKNWVPPSPCTVARWAAWGLQARSLPPHAQP